MAINKNHEFEELNGIKCAIVEKNCTSDRVSFLIELLERNKYTVVVVESPAAKTPPASAKTPPASAKTPPASAKIPSSSAETSSSPGETSSQAETPTASSEAVKKSAPKEEITTVNPESFKSAQSKSPGSESLKDSANPSDTKTGESIIETSPPLPAITYTVGVTDLTFNPINAIFGRSLKTKDNRIVTYAYWKQLVDFSNDELPYFEMKKV